MRDVMFAKIGWGGASAIQQTPETVRLSDTDVIFAVQV
jgi:hypothetical protein